MARTARRFLAALFIVLAAVTFAPAPVAAAVLLFQSETAAMQHCPADTVVWVNTPTGVYHFKGQRWYANTKHGAFVCQKEGDKAGYRATKNGQ
jgi:ABC-type sugar transport system substrate-binding protein